MFFDSFLSCKELLQGAEFLHLFVIFLGRLNLNYVWLNPSFGECFRFILDLFFTQGIREGIAELFWGNLRKDPDTACWSDVERPMLLEISVRSSKLTLLNVEEPKHELDYAYVQILHVIATLRLNSGTGLQMKPTTGSWAYHKPFSSDESLDWFKGKKRNALCFMGKATVSCRLSLKPIQWVSSWNESFLFVGCLGCAAKVRIISPVGWKWQSGGLGLVQKSPLVRKPRRWYNPSAQSYRAAFPQWVMISNKQASKSPYNHHVWFESFDLLM